MNLILAKDDEKAKDLLEKVCEDVRNYELHQQQIADETKKKTIQFLEEVKIGEVVFCQTELDDVILLEKPSPSDYYGHCKYKRHDGITREEWAESLTKISKGALFAEYLIKGPENNTEAKDFEYLARSSGFRVKLIKQEDSYLLKIFGDSQQEVDDFVTYCLQNDYMVY